MVRSIIVEDEIKSANVLKGLIKKYANNKIEIIGEADSIETATKMISTLNPDLIFLDIEIKDGTSFELLERIQFRHIKIIFTTAFDHYAVRAFKFSAIDYLLKPIDDIEFQNAISKTLETSNLALFSNENIQNTYSIYSNPKETYNKKITIRHNNSVYFEELSNVIALKAESSYTEIYCVGNKKYTTSKNLGFYDTLFDTMPQFCRIHNSSIINIENVIEFRLTSYEVLMKENHTFQVSKRKLKELRQALNL